VCIKGILWLGRSQGSSWGRFGRHPSSGRKGAESERHLGAREVVSQRVGGAVRAQLATACPGDELPVTFFGDGVKLADHAFFPFDSRPAQTLIRDILDGHLPRLLKDDHPDGVLLKIIDRVGHTYSAWLQEFARSDPDLADGGERLRQKGDSSSRLNGDEKSPGERLLSKLPERVIRGGRVCEVRGAIAQRLGVTPGVSSAALRSTSAPASRGLRSAFTEVSLLEAAREASAPVARLQ
ncbi:unnamed protein product, partial [Polarella glacialis]